MPPAIKQACEAFLENIRKNMPRHTYVSYKSDLLGQSGFLRSLAPGVKPSADIATVTEETGVLFLQSLLDQGASPATRQRRTSTLKAFLRFAIDAYDLNINIDKLNYKLRSRYLLAGTTTASYYSGEKVQRVLDFSLKNSILRSSGNLQMRRDIAFIWALAETGLRVSEACNMKIGQIDRDWRATFTGKRNTQRSVHFGKNSRDLITAYLKSRKSLDESTGRPRSDLPLFARHDQTSGKNLVKPINVKIGEKIVHNLALLALGNEYDERITAHKFRHYYISNVLKVKGMRAAQIGAGHKNISTTEIYAHMSDDEVANINVEVFG